MIPIIIKTGTGILSITSKVASVKEGNILKSGLNNVKRPQLAFYVFWLYDKQSLNVK